MHQGSYWYLYRKKFVGPESACVWEFTGQHFTPWQALPGATAEDVIVVEAGTPPAYLPNDYTPHLMEYAYGLLRAQCALRTTREMAAAVKAQYVWFTD